MNGRTYNLVERQRNIAIYEAPVCNGRPERMFEVSIVRTEPPKILPSGTELPFREVYPSASERGEHAWTFTPNSHHNPLQSPKAKMAALLARPAPVPEPLVPVAL
jgi:hypothetical protein